jgi:hypothetical protein
VRVVFVLTNKNKVLHSRLHNGFRFNSVLKEEKGDRTSLNAKMNDSMLCTHYSLDLLVY